MDRALETVVRERAIERIRGQLPEFVYTGEFGDAKSGVFEYRMHDDFCFHLIQKVAEYENHFAFSAGWTIHGRYPYGPAGRVPIGCPEKGFIPDVPVDGKMLFDVHQVICPCNSDHTTWVWKLEDLPSSWHEENVRAGKVPLPPDVVSAVHELVDGAIDQIILHVIPYYQRVAREHGYEYPRNVRADR